MHLKLIRYNPNTFLRIKSMVSRERTCTRVVLDAPDWSIINVPSVGKQEFAAMFVYKRIFVGKVSTACSFVTFDCLAKRIRTRLKDRFSSKSCNGTSANVGICVHESTLLDWVLAIDNGFVGLKDDGTVGIVEISEYLGDEETCERRTDFVSKRKRNIFPCIAEEKMMRNTITEACKAVKNMTEDNKEPLFVGIDSLYECSRCGKDIYIGQEFDGFLQDKRQVTLHTLSHGSLKICVRDYLCACGMLVRYDGLFNGIFCATKNHAFSRELLDVWMFDVCGLALTFREAFSLWKRKSLDCFLAKHVSIQTILEVVSGMEL